MKHRFENPLPSRKEQPSAHVVFEPTGQRRKRRPLWVAGAALAFILSLIISRMMGDEAMLTKTSDTGVSSIHGLAPLRYNTRLGQAAMTHACDMAQNGFFGHTGSNGSNSQARVRST